MRTRSLLLVTGISILMPSPALAASNDTCHAGVVHKIYKDKDWTAPFVLVTANGTRFRIEGQDLVDPREWRSGDQLQVCAQPGPGGWVKIRNTSRDETLPAIVMR